MLEALFCGALATGVVRATRARVRLALVAGAIVSYLWLADTLAVFATRTEPAHPLLVIIVLFLGPGAAPTRIAGSLPLPTVLFDWPLVLRALRVALCGLAAQQCFRHASRLNPLLPRAYALDGVALPFAGAAVADALALVLLLASHYYASAG